MLEQITYKDFEKAGIYSGTIISVEDFPRAHKPVYRISVDFGSFGILKTSSQVTDHYTKESLIRKKILGCINLGKKNVAGFQSEFLLLGCYDYENKIVLPEFMLDIQNGSKLL
jgi:tRNA-binding protein